jgi:hypothetical protein
MFQQSGKQYFMQSDIKGTSTAELVKPEGIRAMKPMKTR